MKHAIPPLIAFGVVTLSVALWPLDQPTEVAAFPVSLSAPAVVAEKKEALPGDEPPRSGSSAALANGNVSAEEVLRGVGLDRPILMARFLQTASSEDIKKLLTKHAAGGGGEVVFTGLAWLRWAELDPTAAVAFKPQTSAWWAWSKVDPEAAMQAAKKEGTRAVQDVLSGIAQSDPTMAQKFINASPQDESEHVWGSILDRVGRTDPKEALRLGMEHGAKLDDVVSRWLVRDPAGCLGYAKSIQDPAQRTEVLRPALSALINFNPSLAVEEIFKLPDSESGHSEFLTKAIAALSRENPEAGREAIQRLAPGPDRSAAEATLAAALAAKNPHAALQVATSIDWTSYTSRNNQLPFETRQSMDKAVEHLMFSVPEAMANAMLTLPAENGAPVAYATQKWASFDPESASAWCKALPESANKDKAISGLARWLALENPEPDFEAAVVWGAIASPGARLGIFRRTLDAWKQHDWVAAQSSLSALPITEAERLEISKLFSKP